MALKKNYQKSKNICKVTFMLSKSDVPGAQTIMVMGDFNAWDQRNGIELKKEKKGFAVTIELEAGKTYEYRYLLNGQHWYNDPKPDAYSPSPYMGSLNCVVELAEVDMKKKSRKLTKKSEKSAVKSSTKKSSGKKSIVKKAKSSLKASVASITRAKTPRSTARKATIAQTSTTKSKPVTKRVTTPKSVAKSVKDNLKRIEGIGPKLESILNTKGIKTYDQLAKSSVKALQSILDDAGARFNKLKPEILAKLAKQALSKK